MGAVVFYPTPRGVSKLRFPVFDNPFDWDYN